MLSQQKIVISCLLLGVLAVSWMPSITSAKDEKLKPEELVAKHLESIGPAVKRTAVKTRTTSGTAQVVFRVGGSGTLNGKGNILSQANSIRAGFTFAALEY